LAIPGFCSDLHSDPKARLEPRLPTALAAEDPDVIVFTGDSINSPEGLPVFTHGGQIALPFYGALITLSKFGKRYESGLYHEAQTSMYVNRGIGMEGGFAPRVRFWATPEITTIEIRPYRQ